MRGPIAHVLVAERDPDLARTIAIDLTADGHRTERAATLRQLTDALTDQPPQIILLGTLDHDPVQTVLDLRAERLASGTARIGIVALHRAGDQLAGPRLLRAGADDALPTPPDPVALTARIAALARRLDAAGALPARLRIGTLEIDTGSRQVRVRGRELDLTGREFELLRWLATDPTRVHTKAELLRGIWGHPDALQSRTVDTHAARLRRKLAHAGAPGRVVTVWGVGYRLLDTDIDATQNGAA